ncbi:hypothetical protein COCOBI_05-1970 [Coccomyxa sp. Obi]|nr:hypothetical protein COCOBI_05-1970 [Coccomyxa sp. Obi]
MLAASDLLAAINSTLGTSSPQLPSRSELSGRVRRSSTTYTRKPSPGPDKPGNVSKQTNLGPSNSRKSSVSSLPTAQTSPSRWTDLQKQLPGWLAETYVAEGTPRGQESSRSSLRAGPSPMTPARVSADTKENISSSPAGRWASGVGKIMTSAGKKNTSISSTAMGSGSNGSRRGSAQNSKSRGALSQRFADVVRQAANPAWLSASNEAPAGSAPGMEASRQVRVSQPAVSAAQSTAQDLVGMINARLSGQGRASQEVPSPGTPAGRESRGAAFDAAKTSRPQSRLVAESAGLGSAELADIQALLSQTAKPKPSVQHWQLAAAAVKREPIADRPSIEHPGDSAPKSSSLRDVLQGASKLGMSGAEMEQRIQSSRKLHNLETAMRADSHQQLASQPPAGFLHDQSIAGEQMSRNGRPSWQTAGIGERLAPQNRELYKMLQSSYIDPPSLANLRTKWLQQPGIPNGLLSPPGLRTRGMSHSAASSMHRFDRAATALATAMDAWESMERLSQAAFEQSVRYRGSGPALASLA